MSQRYGRYCVAPGVGALAVRVSRRIKKLVYKHRRLALRRSES